MLETVVTLRIIQHDVGSSSIRHDRRAYLSPDLLRTYKLAAGEWAILSDRQEAQRFVIAQLWPKLSLEDDVIVPSPIQIINLSGKDVALHRFDLEKASQGLLRSVTIEAGQWDRSSGTLPNDRSTKATASERESTWVKAAVKEALVSLRYIKSGFLIAITLGGRDEIQYTVKNVEISTKLPPARSKPDSATLVNKLTKMDLKENGEASFEVYEMNWRTTVVLAGEEVKGATDGGVRNHNWEHVITVTQIFRLMMFPDFVQTSKMKLFDDSTPSYINLSTPPPTSTSSYSLLGGLDPQIKLIKSLLDLPLLHPDLFTLFGLTPPRGILLHGPPGTGKTALARAVASSLPGCSCIVVNGPELSSAYHGETEERLRGVFEEAKRRSPCIVVLDEIDALCPRRDGDGGEVEKRVVATLLTVMDGMNDNSNERERVFVIAATNRPNSIDPALRRPGRFDREIEIGIPDAIGRREIIEIMLAKMPHYLTSKEITALAARTHGYVGADLSSLVRESASAAIQRWHTQPAESSLPTLTQADIMATLSSIRPSAMREVFVETPTVKWSDIGGQDEVKQKLQECVEWPLTHHDTFKRLGVEAPKGVLLYGPPGCSKTMTAKALATESGINFLAVKGPELLNKYVGESERAVREVFRKARAASPSIIFFDEIDALGSARSDDVAHSGVLTSLLNEMDGIEELSGVTVVAATNRPDVLDPALMRPGRLDRILYVGTPDLATRREIFRIRLATMAIEPNVDVDELSRLTVGCSGAEVVSICQDAALAAMNEDLEAPFVKRSHLEYSAKTVRRRITPDMNSLFEEWRDQSGVRSA